MTIIRMSKGLRVLGFGAVSLIAVATAALAADRGFYPVCIPDACATHSEARHENALEAFAGYCRTMPTAQLIAAIEGSIHEIKNNDQDLMNIASRSLGRNQGPLSWPPPIEGDLRPLPAFPGCWHSGEDESVLQARQPRRASTGSLAPCAACLSRPA